MTGEEVIKNAKVLLSKLPALDDQINKFGGFGAAQPSENQTWVSSQLYLCTAWEISTAVRGVWKSRYQQNRQQFTAELRTRQEGHQQFGWKWAASPGRRETSVLREKNTYSCREIALHFAGFNVDEFPAAHGDLWKLNMKPKSCWLILSHVPTEQRFHVLFPFSLSAGIKAAYLIWRFTCERYKTAWGKAFISPAGSFTEITTQHIRGPLFLE